MVDIQERVVTRDRFGSEVESWEDFVTVWARVRGTGVREQYVTNADREQALRNAIMRIRYREDITAARHRIIYDEHAWDILGVDEAPTTFRRFLDLTVQTEIGGLRFMPTPFTVKAGLSADAVPIASDFTIDHASAYIEFPAFVDMHIVLWRDASEPDLTQVVFSSDPTAQNQFLGFTKYATTVEIGGVQGNAWVSDQLLTFPTAEEVDVA